MKAVEDLGRPETKLDPDILPDKEAAGSKHEVTNARFTAITTIVIPSEATMSRQPPTRNKFSSGSRLHGRMSSADPATRINPTSDSHLSPCFVLFSSLGEPKVRAHGICWPDSCALRGWKGT